MSSRLIHLISSLKCNNMCYRILLLITRPIWKCPCIKLFIAYFRHLEKRHPYWPETKSRTVLARANMGLDMEMIFTFQFTLCCYGFPPSSSLTDYVFNTMSIAFYYILSSNKGIFVWPIWPEVNCPYFHTPGK
jgi:hypothetical protein